VRARIHARLDVPDKEFEKFKLAVVVMGRQKSIADTSEEVVHLEDFTPLSQGSGMQARPWLGLDHINKTPKNSRYPNYQEKAIKIHN